MSVPTTFPLIFTVAACVAAADESTVHRLSAVPISQVVVTDEFWSPKLKVWRDVTIPDCLAKFEKDGALSNFDKVRDGTGGEHGGPAWYDGLIYETQPSHRKMTKKLERFV